MISHLITFSVGVLVCWTALKLMRDQDTPSVPTPAPEPEVVPAAEVVVPGTEITVRDIDTDEPMQVEAIQAKKRKKTVKA